MYTLGINAAFHDPAACLVKDGKVIAAAEEERFTHIKHGKRPIPFSTYELPFYAIDYCLREAGIVLAEVDHVAYSFDPYLLLGRHADDSALTLPLKPNAHPTPGEWESVWEPLFLSSIVNAPRYLKDGAPHHLQTRFQNVWANGDYTFRWHFVEHHLAHAASAFHVSPFTHAAVLTLDGRGEKATTSYSAGYGNQLERLGQVNMPHSLYYDLLKAFQRRTGVPVLVNISFNTLDEPIVCTPRDAVECFWTSPLDALVIGSFLLEKPEGQNNSKKQMSK